MVNHNLLDPVLVHLLFQGRRLHHTPSPFQETNTKDSGLIKYLEVSCLDKQISKVNFSSLQFEPNQVFLLLINVEMIEVVDLISVVSSTSQIRSVVNGENSK